MNNKTITVLNLIGLSAGGSPQLSKEMIQAALASAAQSLKGATIYRIAV